MQFQEERRVSGLEADFSLGLINLDNETRQVRFSYPENDNYELEFDENPLPLESSTVTSNPEKEAEWYSLGDGRYATIKEIVFQVEIEETAESRNFTIPVTVNAVYGEGSAGGASQNAIQSRTYSFNLVTTSQSIQPAAEDFYSDGSLFDSQESNTTSGGGEDGEVEEASGSQQGNLTRENISEPEKGLTEQSQHENEAVNEWTIMFLLGTIISVVLIAREVL